MRAFRPSIQLISRLPISLSLLIAVLLLVLALLPLPRFAPAVRAQQAVASNPLTPATAAQLREVGRYGRGVIHQIAWSADGQVLALATSLGVSLADWRGTSPMSRLVDIPQGSQSAVFSPDGRLLAVGAADGTLYLWDLEAQTFRATVASHLYEVSALAFNRAGDALASADASGIVRVWQVPQLTEQLVMESVGTPTELAFSADGTLLAVAGTLLTHIVDLQTGAFRSELPAARALAFDPDDHALVMISTISRTDELSVLQRWDADTGEPRSEAAAARALVDIGFDADGRLIAYTHADGQVIGNDLATGEVTLTTPVSESASTVVIGTRQVAERSSSERVLVYPLGEGWESPARATALFSPQFTGLVLDQTDPAAGTVGLLAYGDRLARRLDLATGNVSERPLPPQTPGVLTGPGGHVARFGGGSVVLLETPTANAGEGTTALTLSGHSGVVRAAAFSPDGSRLATAGDDSTVHLWDAATGSLLAVLHGHIRAVYGVAFSPDGALLASASLDRSIRLWDVSATAALDASVNQLFIQTVTVLEGHTAGVTAVLFLPDGSRLASASYDGTVRLWGVPE